MKFSLAIIFALAISGCASTSSNQASITQEAGAEQQVKTKKICKTVSKIGSNFKKRQCWTQQEYAVMQKAHQEQLQRMKDNESSMTRGGVGSAGKN